MKLDLFSIPIYIGDIDCDKIKIDHKGWRKNWLSETKTSHSFSNEVEKDSAHYLLQTIAKLIKDDFNFDANLRLCSVWENHYKDNDFQEPHIHANSHLSFIIYKKVEESRTVFIHPYSNMLETFYGMMPVKSFERIYEPKCKSNQIVVFPSCLQHMVKKMSNSITIAGNLLIDQNESNK